MANTSGLRKSKGFSLAKKISKLKRTLNKLMRAIEKEAFRKKQREEVRKLENQIQQARKTLEKTRSFGRAY